MKKKNKSRTYSLLISIVFFMLTGVLLLGFTQILVEFIKLLSFDNPTAQNILYAIQVLIEKRPYTASLLIYAKIVLLFGILTFGTGYLAYIIFSMGISSLKNYLILRDKAVLKRKKSLFDGKSKDFPFTVFFLLILVALVFVGVFIYLMNTSHSCYTEKYIFLREYIGKTQSKVGGDCSTGCLFIEVKDPVTKEIKTFYFAGEKELRGYKPNSMISVRWCYIPLIDDWRIRGVWEE